MPLGTGVSPVSSENELVTLEVALARLAGWQSFCISLQYGHISIQPAREASSSRHALWLICHIRSCIYCRKLIIIHDIT